MTVKFSGEYDVVAYLDTEKFGRKVVGYIVRFGDRFTVTAFTETYTYEVPKPDTICTFNNLEDAKQYIIDEWTKEVPM